MSITALVVTTLLITAGLYDLAVVVLGYCRGKDIAFSISRFMQWLPRRATFFTCICFYVMGHFWGFMDCPDCPQPVPQPSPAVPVIDEGNLHPPIVVMGAAPHEHSHDDLKATREDWEELHRLDEKTWGAAKKALDSPEHPHWHDDGKHHARSPEWPKVREAYLKDHPACEACGSTEELQVHHVEPFHLHPEKELDPTNLITLCAGKHECHLRLGHAFNFKAYNPHVREDAALQRKRIAERKFE